MTAFSDITMAARKYQEGESFTTESENGNLPPTKKEVGISKSIVDECGVMEKSPRPAILMVVLAEAPESRTCMLLVGVADSSTSQDSETRSVNIQ